jgi:hypothetical protein
MLACYSGAGFDVGLRDAARADPRMQLFGLDVLYSCDRRSGHGGALFVDLAVRGGRRSNTLRPARGRGVIFAGHNDLRAPVAQPDRAAAF